jgi:hypothetical protein
VSHRGNFRERRVEVGDEIDIDQKACARDDAVVSDLPAAGDGLPLRIADFV